MGNLPAEKVFSVLKGMQAASYSGFDGVLASDPTQTMDDFLKTHDVRDITIVGIATDYCVDATIRDALRYGYQVTAIPVLCAGIDSACVGEIYAEYPSLGVTLGQPSKPCR